MTILSNDRKRPVVQVALQARVQVAQKPEPRQQLQEPVQPTQPPPEEVSVPTQEGVVTDTANVLAEEVKAQLAQLFQELREQIKAEVFLLTVPSAQELSLKDYAAKVMEQWKLESERAVVILLLPERREATIVVSKELQSEIPPEKAEEIVQSTIIPAIQADEIANSKERIGEALSSCVKAGTATDAVPADCTGSSSTTVGHRRGEYL